LGIIQIIGLTVPGNRTRARERAGVDRSQARVAAAHDDLAAGIEPVVCAPRQNRRVGRNRGRVVCDYVGFPIWADVGSCLASTAPR
jgi:hypothetical protein